MKMRPLLYSLLLSTALLSAGSAAAQQVVAGGDLKPLTPPQADFKKVCNPLWQPKVDVTRNWSGWDGKTTTLPPRDMFEHAKLYRFGNHTVPPNPELAVEILSVLSQIKSGYQAPAQHMLADMYRRGLGIMQDDAQAFALFESAWKLGKVESAHGMALVLIDKGDFLQAANYLLKSANAGNAQSALALAYMYKNGSAPAPNPEAARNMRTLGENFLLADLAKGNCNVLYEFGSLYANGLLVDQDKEVARLWFEAAADAGFAKAMNEVADIYLTTEGGEEAAQKAVAMWQRAADLGSAPAMFRLGFSYYKGEGVKQDIDQGVKWMEKAAVFGNPGATEFLVKHFLGDDENNPNYAAAFEWLGQASALPKSNPDLLVMLGEAHRLGQGTERDEQEAFSLYERAAARGSKDGFFKLGEAYLFGRGIEQDPIKSLRFFRVAAQRGHQEAARQLIKIYQCGMGIEPNQKTALNWRERAISAVSTTAMIDAARDYYAQGSKEQAKRGFELILEAAEEDDRRAMALVSLAYANGHGVEKNATEAERWQEKALTPGEKLGDAPYTFAQSYLKGFLAPKDTKAAEEYLQHAVKAEHITAYYELGRRYLEGKDGFPKKPEEGERLLKKAAARDNIAAMNILARHYIAHPDPKNPDRGQKWLEKAANAGHILSMLRLAEASQLGRGVPVDMEAAEEWVKRAEKSFPCDISELMALGRSYARGLGVNADGKRATYYLERAAQAKNVDAMRELGMMYFDGLAGIPRDGKVGLTWLKQAAELGDARSMLALGNAYAAGDGVERSAKEAALWWKKSADAGNKDAALRLEAMDATTLKQ